MASTSGSTITYLIEQGRDSIRTKVSKFAKFMDTFKQSRSQNPAELERHLRSLAYQYGDFLGSEKRHTRNLSAVERDLLYDGEIEIEEIYDRVALDALQLLSMLSDTSRPGIAEDLESFAKFVYMPISPAPGLVQLEALATEHNSNDKLERYNFSVLPDASERQLEFSTTRDSVDDELESLNDTCELVNESHSDSIVPTPQNVAQSVREICDPFDDLLGFDTSLDQERQMLNVSLGTPCSTPSVSPSDVIIDNRNSHVRKQVDVDDVSLVVSLSNRIDSGQSASARLLEETLVGTFGLVLQSNQTKPRIDDAISMDLHLIKRISVDLADIRSLRHAYFSPLNLDSISEQSTASPLDSSNQTALELWKESLTLSNIVCLSRLRTIAQYPYGINLRHLAIRASVTSAPPGILAPSYLTRRHSQVFLNDRNNSGSSKYPGIVLVHSVSLDSHHENPIGLHQTKRGTGTVATRYCKQRLRTQLRRDQHNRIKAPSLQSCNTVRNQIRIGQCRKTTQHMNESTSVTREREALHTSHRTSFLAILSHLNPSTLFLILGSFGDSIACMLEHDDKYLPPRLSYPKVKLRYTDAYTCVLSIVRRDNRDSSSSHGA